MEIGGKPHTNPDGKMIGRNHIHIHKEGYGLRWAYDLENFLSEFSVNGDFNVLFEEICAYCNIRTPEIQTVM